MAKKKTAKKTAAKKKAPKLSDDQQAKVDDRESRAEAAAKKDPKYQGETENTAPYMNSYE